MEVSRRRLAELATAGIAMLSMPGLVAAQQDQDNDIQSYGHIFETLDNRPEPDSAFFANKVEYGYVFTATDTGEQYFIEDGDTSWTKLLQGGSQWSETDSDDLLELPDHTGIDVGQALVQGEKVLTDGLLPTQPQLGFDTWRTPHADRTTAVTVTFNLDSGSVSESRVDVELDTDTDDVAEITHPINVPAGLSAAQFRNVPSLLVPAGAQYRFNLVSEGSNADIVEHEEQIL